MSRLCLIADGSEALRAAFRDRGYTVLAYSGRPDAWALPDEPIDVLVCAARAICADDGAGLRELPDVGAFDAALKDALIVPLAQLRRVIAQMENGEKRIAFFTDVRASANLCERSGAYPARMAEAAKHMRLAILHEELRKRGFCVRLIDPGDDADAACAAQAVLCGSFADANNDERFAGRRFVMQDARGREYPW